MTAKSQTLAVTPRYRWRIRNQEEDVESSQDCAADVFFLKRQRKLFGDKTPDPNQNLLQLLPEPHSFKDIGKATQRILSAMDNGEPITIFGDYDVDGTTSCAMLRRFFQEIGYPVNVYIPERLIEGYGLNPLGLRKIKDLGCKLVITVDNGISAVEACATANELGMDVIITDHHDLPPELPAAFAILNPKQRDCQFPFKMLAGVGVAFYLMVSLRAALKERNASRYGSINLRSYLDFVALGTIADLAPLDGVNHILCKTGLEVMLQEVRKGKRQGIAALLDLTGWKSETGLIEAADVGFKLGPCLNAAGRLGTALASEEILSTEDPTRARELALFLSGENAERQRIERAIKDEAFAQIQELGSIPPALILHAEHWHPGVVGIVASRVLEKYYRPTLILGTLDGKIGVYTGLLPVAKNEAGLAAILGHEVAHATARHAAERMSQGLILQAGLTATDMSLSNSRYRGGILAALGVGAQFGVLLPYSRMHESEADRIGLEYMAKAGYDPREAASLWDRMATLGNAHPPEFLATHPNPSKRADEIRNSLDGVMALYEQSQKQPSQEISL